MIGRLSTGGSRPPTWAQRRVARGLGGIKEPVMRMLLKEPLLTVSEVAERLRVSTKTVRRRIKDGSLRSIRISGLIRIAMADLEDFIRDH
jgi:excisionase family DNA binding protein